MKVTRDIILDLLPLYLSGETSHATRELVEEYLKQDPELAEQVRTRPESLPQIAPPALPPELELRSLVRTRGLLRWQRWLFALAITFTAIGLTSSISFKGGRVTDFHFLIRDYPAEFGTCMLLGIACWTVYVIIRRRLRASAL